MASIFTKIINREIPADIVYETEDIIAFNDINPQAKYHILVVPKKEISTINDIQKEDTDLIGKIYLAIKEITKELGIDKTGYRVITNCNEDGGQEVFHIHFHILGGEKIGPMRSK
ncbi:histidine triad (HIT) family protein [Hypnocyclicus thermotrophus]|uniref:Histidine triad (HIT) family protein n=1 Tax=Hypnocyclicus thermotrophus TaxID=1627895 RepID=A0AA46E0B6_9FUSO|nr:histidine triad nucleotide-binding protein [Hypnocyclicus thermotrophus]TDT71971.1 histidine triad (HIT) family protein [Hypnocyclicus thermotrophus]